MSDDLVERGSIRIDAEFRRVYDSGQLVHRSFGEREDDARHMRLVPCARWWVSDSFYLDTRLHPTCIACIACVTVTR